MPKLARPLIFLAISFFYLFLPTGVARVWAADPGGPSCSTFQLSRVVGTADDIFRVHLKAISGSYSFCRAAAVVTRRGDSFDQRKVISLPNVHEQCANKKACAVSISFKPKQLGFTTPGYYDIWFTSRTPGPDGQCTDDDTVYAGTYGDDLACSDYPDPRPGHMTSPKDRGPVPYCGQPGQYFRLIGAPRCEKLTVSKAKVNPGGKITFEAWPKAPTGTTITAVLFRVVTAGADGCSAAAATLPGVKSGGSWKATWEVPAGASAGGYTAYAVVINSDDYRCTGNPGGLCPEDDSEKTVSCPGCRASFTVKKIKKKDPIPLPVPVCEHPIALKGVSGEYKTAHQDLDIVWYHNWQHWDLNYFGQEKLKGGEAEFIPMVRVGKSGSDSCSGPWQYPDFSHYEELIKRTAQAYPGRYWLIGNEPEIGDQDGIQEECAYQRYKEGMELVRSIDPGAQFIVGGWHLNPERRELNEYGLAPLKDEPGFKGWQVHINVDSNQEIATSVIDFSTMLATFTAWAQENKPEGMEQAEIWVTEFLEGPWGGDRSAETENVNALMREIVPILDCAATRYSWYYLADKPGESLPWTLYTSGGAIKPLGELYGQLGSGQVLGASTSGSVVKLYQKVLPDGAWTYAGSCRGCSLIDWVPQEAGDYQVEMGSCSQAGLCLTWPNSAETYRVDDEVLATRPLAAPREEGLLGRLRAFLARLWPKVVAANDEVRLEVTFRLSELERVDQGRAVRVGLLDQSQVYQLVALPRGEGIYAGGLNLPASLAGTVRVGVKPAGYLQRVKETTLVPGQISSLDFTDGEFLAGDLNEDNRLTIADLVEDILPLFYTTRQLSLPVPREYQLTDLNHDGVINILDISLILKNLTALEVPGET